MTRSATTTTPNVPNVPVESVRADDLRVTDVVWFQSWDGSWQRGPVRSLELVGDDVEVKFLNRASVDPLRSTESFTTSQGNGVFVEMR